MNIRNTICLKPSSILNVPLNSYEDDFHFIVNGKEFKTSRIIADLLSPTICKNHLNDRTMNEFIINTQYSGDFSQILKIINFDIQTLKIDEIPFIMEVIKQLNNESIEIQNDIEISCDNVIELLQSHERNKTFYSKNISDEIEFIATHFSELYESEKEKLMKISVDSLFEIFRNEELSLKSEDQLLDIINYLYKVDPRYSILYETVYFENVSNEKIYEFVHIFNYNQMNSEIWNRLSKKFQMKSDEVNERHYPTRFKSISKYKRMIEKIDTRVSKEFNGILSHLKRESNGHIEQEVNISASSIYNWSQLPRSVTNYTSNQKSFFMSNNVSNSWIMFEFKNYKVKIYSYTIKSREKQESSHPRSWVIEGSNNNHYWEILDVERDCPILNGADVVHTFDLMNRDTKEFKYIRMRLIGKTWNNTDSLSIALFELNGILV